MTGPQVVGEPAADRICRSLDYRLHPGTPPLTTEQVAVVLRALADHTLLEAAAVYDRDDRHHPGRETPWPTTTSIGRFLHAAALDLEMRTR